MSLALIEESAKEVRRLAIAGSALAVGDFRLKKLIAPLEQAGAKVPVFAQVAKSIGDLVNGTETDSSIRLLNVSTLINAILYTQGQSGADADFQDLEGFATNCSSTRVTARVLKPLIEALTSSGAGRFEVVKSACDRGAFNDLRLIDPAIQALGDSFPELADLVAHEILPGYGAGIVSRLKANLDLKGKKGDARKLKVMHQLEPAGTLELCKKALEDGSPEIKAAAIACLGKREDCLPLVVEQANSKNKMLRAAALEVLAEHDRPEIVKLFAELIKGKALDILVAPLRTVRSRQVLASLLGEGKRVFDLIVKGDAEQIPRFWEILNCLEQRKDSGSEEFLLACFDQCAKLTRLKAAKNSHLAGTDLTARLASLLYSLGSTRTLEAVLAKRTALPALAFTQVLRSALRLWPVDKVYLEFAPLLEQKKGAAKEMGEEIERTVLAARRVDFSSVDIADEDESTEADALQKLEWDPRWLDAAIKANRQLMVWCLARPGHQGTIAYLLKLLETKNQFRHGLIIHALARCQYPKVTDVFLDVIAKRVKGAKYLDYELQLLFESARHLPMADLPRLDALAAKLDEKFLDKYLESLEPLRKKPVESQ
jgi:HEAT repeat protein